MKKPILSIALCTFFSCVGPAEPDHGFVENLPAIINKSDVFSFSLRAENFNYNETFPLSLSIPSNKKILSTLIITDFSSNDSSTFHVLGENDAVVFDHLIQSNKTLTSSKDHTALKNALVHLNNFSGIVNWVVTSSND